MSVRARVMLSVMLSSGVALADEAARFPAAPWRRVTHTALPAPTVLPLIPRPGGGAAAVLGPAGAVALLGADGRLGESFGTDGNTASRAWWVDRETIQLTRGRDLLLTYTIEGSLRAALRTGEQIAGGVAAPEGGTVLAFLSASPLVGARVRWDDLDPIGFGARHGWRPATSAPCLDGRGGVWIAAGDGLVRVSPSRLDVAITRGIRSLTPRAGGGLIAAGASAAYLVDEHGAILGTTPLNASVMSVAARHDGGAAILVQRSPPSVITIDPTGGVRARFDAPGDARALTVDADDAILTASRSGELAVYEADGAPRWRLTLPVRLRPPLVALDAGRFAVAAEGAELIVLDDP